VRRSDVVSQDTGRPMADVELVVTKAGVESPEQWVDLPH